MGVEREDEFAVGAGLEGVCDVGEEGGEVRGEIEFAVYDCGDGEGGVVEGLSGGGGEVVYGEAGVGEGWGC